MHCEKTTKMPIGYKNKELAGTKVLRRVLIGRKTLGVAHACVSELCGGA
jgi:hypothetical protein